MANFEPALEKTLINEGGFFVNTSTGEIVNRGITLTFVRDCGYCSTADQGYIQNLTMDQTQDIYRKYFWDPHNLDNLESQDVANKVFDLTVNLGPGGVHHDGALTLFQKAICDCGGDCTVDGVLGPMTIKEANSVGEDELLTAYRQRAKQRYQEIAETNPKLQCNLTGWLDRLAK